MVSPAATCDDGLMGTVICCDVCRIPFLLDELAVIACAEVLTFADAHGEHEGWSLALRSQTTCTCRRRAAGGRRSRQPSCGLPSLRERARDRRRSSSRRWH